MGNLFYQMVKLPFKTITGKKEWKDGQGNKNTKGLLLQPAGMGQSKAGKVEENLQGLLKWPWATWQEEDHKPKRQ